MKIEFEYVLLRIGLVHAYGKFSNLFLPETNLMKTFYSAFAIYSHTYNNLQ